MLLQYIIIIFNLYIYANKVEGSWQILSQFEKKKNKIIIKYIFSLSLSLKLSKEINSSSDITNVYYVNKEARTRKWDILRAIRRFEDHAGSKV